MDTLTRRELFRRLGRAAIAGPILLATREQQGDLVFRLAEAFGGKGSILGRWLRSVWLWW